MSRQTTENQFFELTPERVLKAVEKAGLECNNFCYPLNSFENRVYEVELVDKSRIVAKFYRPGRWSMAQILEEHDFLGQLTAAEVPVCSVRTFPDGSTLKSIEGIHYCLSDRRGGRAPDELDGPMAFRLGMLVGRLHMIGGSGVAVHRRPLDSEHFIRRPIAWLAGQKGLPVSLESRYLQAAEAIADIADWRMPRFESIRVHADLHLGNMLLRNGVLRVLDFDDMASGPAVQDLWLALPGRDEATLELRQAFLTGYEQFRLFDRSSLCLIEILRGLRMVRYAVWLARRWDDPAFRLGWPQFGTREFWEVETRDLEEQLARIRADQMADTLARSSGEVPTTRQIEESLTNKDYFWDWEEN